MKQGVANELEGQAPEELATIFSDTSVYFRDDVLSRWRIAKRYDDLTDYISYVYFDHDGDTFWGQALLDLRMLKDSEGALRLLEGLLPGRRAKYRAMLKRQNSILTITSDTRRSRSRGVS